MAHIPDEDDLTSRTLRDRLLEAPEWPSERRSAPPATTDTQTPG
jgi:hypothetical protein